MIVNESIRSTANESNNGKQFTIANNSRSFKILSDGIYSDKITAVIRELSCNAYDSHVASGKPTQPFDVHIPTYSEPYFEVVDYGTGISDSDIYDIYTSYFTSTKTASNEFVGQLGLGSKSPFCYTNEFFVNSKFAGKNRKYRLYYDACDTPTVAFVEETDCGTDTGVAVRFNVKTSDFYGFAVKAANVFRWFDIKPNIKGESITIRENKASIQGPSWTITESSENRNATTMVYARMGNVAYPVEYSNMNFSDDIIGRAWSVPLVVDFKIGDLEIAASREALSYDLRTIANINNRILEVIDEFNAIINAMFAEKTTEYEVRKLFHEVFAKSGLHQSRRHLLKKNIEFNTVEITDSIIDFAQKDLYNLPLPGYVKTASIDRKNAKIVKDETLKLPCDSSQFILMVDDVDKNASSIAKNYIDNGDHKKLCAWAYIIKTPDKMSFEHFDSFIGHHPYIRLSTLPKPEKKVKPARGPRKNLLMMNGFRSKNLSKISRDIASLHGYSLNMTADGYVKLPNGKFLSLEYFNSALHNIKEISGINMSLNVFAPLSEKYEAEFKANKNLIDLGQLAIDYLSSVINDESMNDSYRKVKIWKSMVYSSRVIPNHVNFHSFNLEIKDENSVIGKIHKIDKEISELENLPQYKKYTTCLSVCDRIINIVWSDTEAQHKERFSSLFKALDERYAMLRFLTGDQWRREISSINEYIEIVDTNYYQIVLATPDTFDEPTFSH